MGDTPIGTVAMSYMIQPCGRDGRELNGGMSYANAATIEAAREVAARMLRDSKVRSVSISGREMRLGWAAWAPVKGGRYEHETVKSDLPFPHTAADLRASCYSSTVMDYFEIVHELRSDGTCQCGNPDR